MIVALGNMIYAIEFWILRQVAFGMFIARASRFKAFTLIVYTLGEERGDNEVVAV